MSKLTHSTDEGMRQIDERRAREDGEAPKAGHTDGPWHAMACADGFWIGNDNENTAFVPGFTDHPLNQANANVVAAAPDMLAALKECSEELAAEIEARYANTKDHPAMKRRYDRDMDAVVSARAIISKAEGRTP